MEQHIRLLECYRCEDQNYENCQGFPENYEFLAMLIGENNWQILHSSKNQYKNTNEKIIEPSKIKWLFELPKKAKIKDWIY